LYARHAPPTVTVSFGLSGDASSYGATEKTALQNVVATAASVSPSRVTIEVTSGSVLVQATISAANDASAMGVKSTLATGVMASTSALTTALAAQSSLASFSVTAAPTVVSTTDPPVAAVASEDSGLSTGVIIGLIVGVVAGLVLLLFLAYKMTKGKKVDVKPMAKKTATTSSSSSTSSSQAADA
jgi:hypothetical protein